MAQYLQIQPRQLFQIKITLRDIKPLIWRRVIVPSDFTLEQLHDTIQICLGWQNMHLYQFLINDLIFGPVDDDMPDSMIDASLISLSKIIARLPKIITYTYDFGDSWEHEIKFEKIVPHEKGMKIPCCVDGKRAFPPEDCGGIPGYEDILEAIKNPKKKENKELLEWLGEFDPEGFDLLDVNEQLRDSI